MDGVALMSTSVSRVDIFFAVVDSWFTPRWDYLAIAAKRIDFIRCSVFGGITSPFAKVLIQVRFVR